MKLFFLVVNFFLKIGCRLIGEVDLKLTFYSSIMSWVYRPGGQSATPSSEKRYKTIPCALSGFQCSTNIHVQWSIGDTLWQLEKLDFTRIQTTGTGIKLRESFHIQP